MKLVAVLSTTVLVLDGTYQVHTTKLLETMPRHIDLHDTLHYIGHTDTRAIVESMGSVKAPNNLFSGLEPGESALCFSIKQGRSSRVNTGTTEPNQALTIEDLDVRLLTRIR